MRKTYKLQRVENLPRPAEIKEGVFYLSEDGKDSVHKCPCGCGEEIYLLLNSKDIDDFSYDCNVINNELTTLRPEVYNSRCKTCYTIRENKVSMVKL